MAETAIEWATHVWNPVTGCDRVSPGCANCYALTYAGRLKAMGQPKYQRDGGRASGPGFGVTLHDDVLLEPLSWRKPRPRVFVNSMSDLFHDEVDTQFIARTFAIMALASAHGFLVLTKRPERMRDVIGSVAFAGYVRMVVEARGGEITHWPLPNVWLGVSIENRRFVHRADLLRQTPAAVRFISAEPLLGPLVPRGTGCYCFANVERAERPWRDGYNGPALSLEAIDWLITGGESGAGARRLDPQWCRDLRDACHHAGVAYFHKQNGGRTPKAGGRELDGRTWDELPTSRSADHASPDEWSESPNPSPCTPPPIPREEGVRV